MNFNSVASACGSFSDHRACLSGTLGSARTQRSYAECLRVARTVAPSPNFGGEKIGRYRVTITVTDYVMGVVIHTGVRVIMAECKET